MQNVLKTGPWYIVRQSYVAQWNEVYSVAQLMVRGKAAGPLTSEDVVPLGIQVYLKTLFLDITRLRNLNSHLAKPCESADCT